MLTPPILALLCLCVAIVGEYLGEDRWLDEPHLFGAVAHSQQFVDSSEAPPEHGVEVVLDVVVRPSLEDLGDFGPLVAVLLMRLEHGLLLFRRPLFLLDLGVEMIVPSS